MSALPSTANIHRGTVTSALCHDQARIWGQKASRKGLLDLRLKIENYSISTYAT
jgi:hypothetical protein